MHALKTLLTTVIAVAAATTITKEPSPTTTCTKGQGHSTSCTETICADYVNSCGQWYGGCYPACSGYTTPSFTDPGCPPTITSSSTLSSSTSSCGLTICADYTNSCGMMYGTCYPACSGYPTPTPTPPECPTTSSSKTRKPCTKTKCEDYINSCGQTYGGKSSHHQKPSFLPLTSVLGCYKACKGYPTPTFTDPGCPTSATPYNPSETSSCAFVCSDFFDDCGNTFGPGCCKSS